MKTREAKHDPRKYEPPRLFPLGQTLEGQGACGAGSGNADCNNGNNATTDCNSGLLPS